MKKELLGYKLFLPAVAAATRTTKKSSNQLSDKEFKQIVANTFLDAMIEFTKDSLLYRVELPIDLFQGVERYELIPPKGFLVEDITTLTGGKFKAPTQYCNDLESITLSCCPTKDIYAAFYVKVALSPKRSNSLCKFPEDFLERYYDAILSGMFARFAAMDGRTWRSLGSIRRHEKRYEKFLRQAKRRSLAGGGIIRIKNHKLTDL